MSQFKGREWYREFHESGSEVSYEDEVEEDEDDEGEDDN